VTWRKKEVTEEANRLGLWRPLALGVLLAHRVAGAAVPEAVLRRFQSDAAACSLARHFEKTLCDVPGSPPLGRPPYNIQLLGSCDRARLLLSLDFLRPRERSRSHPSAALARFPLLSGTPGPLTLG